MLLTIAKRLKINLIAQLDQFDNLNNRLIVVDFDCHVYIDCRDINNFDAAENIDYYKLKIDEIDLIDKKTDCDFDIRYHIQSSTNADD